MYKIILFFVFYTQQYLYSFDINNINSNINIVKSIEKESYHFVKNSKFVSNDKILHLTIGYFFYSSCIVSSFLFDFNKKYCLASTFILGIGKEVYDYYHPKTHSVEAADVLATVSTPILFSFNIKF